MQAANRYADGREWPSFGREVTLWDEDATVPRAIYSTHDACIMLGGIDYKTLQRWAKAAGIVPDHEPGDKRVVVWTYGQLQHIAEFKHRRIGKPPAENDTSRMRRLENELDRLKERLAELEARAAGILPRLSATTTPQDGAGDAAGDDQEQLQALRQKRALARHTADSVPLLPDGWIAFSSWCQLHDLNKRSSDRYVASGRLEQPRRGVWVNPLSGQRVERAYTPEQRATADAQLATIQQKPQVE